ncbi:MAG: hypothetical protein QXW79_01555 [Thermoplasmata archaeon]
MIQIISTLIFSSEDKRRIVDTVRILNASMDILVYILWKKLVCVKKYLDGRMLDSNVECMEREEQWNIDLNTNCYLYPFNYI